MPETLNTQLSELASRASNSATLDEAATLRKRGNRRIRRRRGSSALLGAATVAAAVSLGVTMTGGSTTPQATAAAQTAPSPTSLPPTSTTQKSPAQESLPPLPTSRGTLAPTAWAHIVQIYDQLQNVNSYSVGDSSYAVITKASSYAYEVKFFAGADGTTVVNGFGATWAQVIAGYLGRGFTNVTIRTQASSTLPTDAVIDVQNSAGVSVLGQRIPLTTPIVLVAAR
jgi:hypothetical protein